MRETTRRLQKINYIPSQFTRSSYRKETILKDFQDYINSLRELFKAHGLVLKFENQKNSKHFRPSDIPVKPYIVVAIESSKKLVRDRWKNCPFLFVESDWLGLKNF